MSTCECVENEIERKNFKRTECKSFKLVERTSEQETHKNKFMLIWNILSQAIVVNKTLPNG